MPDLAIVLAAGADGMGLAPMLQKALSTAGLDVRRSSEGEQAVLSLRVGTAVLAAAAEADGLLKMTAGPDRITGRPRLEPFTRKRAATFAGWGSPEFFLPCERARIAQELAEGVEADAGGAARAALAWASGRFPTKRNGAERGLLGSLVSAGAVAAVFPPHDADACRRIWNGALAAWPGHLPVGAMREYFGSETAFYFAWLDHLTAWLAGPAAAGLALFLLRPPGETADTDVESAVFSAAVVLWGFAYVASWRRRQSELACAWDTLDEAHADRPNPAFRGAPRVSPVTGEEEPHYPSWRRWAIHYPVSLVVTAAMLALAFAVMALSLNLQGYVHGGSPIYVAGLAAFSAPGAPFDQGALLPSLLPVAMHTAVILGLNKAYSGVAEWLTDMENHGRAHEREHSLVVKRFFFELADCFAPLVYLAFYERDIAKLRGELASLYTMDSLRRIAVEVLLPLGIAAARRAGRTVAAEGPGPRDGEAGGPGSAAALVAEAELEEYDSFDDFLEMVVQLGYVTLLAAAFPLAAPLSLACNLVEARSDAFKLAFVARRPPSRRAGSIGPWLSIATGIVWAAAVTNVLVMGLTTEQLMTAFPGLFSEAAGGEHRASKGGVELMVVIEHALLAAGMAIGAAVRPRPAWVRDDVARRRHEQRLAERARSTA